MKKLSFLLSAAAIVLGSCGGGQQNNSTVGSQQNNIVEAVSGNSNGLKPVSADVIHNAFEALIRDNMPTGWMEDEEAYDFGASLCHYVREEISGARSNTEAGNYAALGCFPRSNGDVLVVRYVLVQHWNGHSMEEGPEVCYFNYNPTDKEFKEISNPDFLTIDSTDFQLENPFVRYGNEIYFAFDEQSIMLNLTNGTGFPEQTYKWNGEKFVKQPLSADEMAKAHTNDHPNHIPASWFDCKNVKNRVGTVVDKNGKTEVEVSYSDRDGVKSIRIFTPKYWVDGVGVGQPLSSLDPEYFKISGQTAVDEYEATVTTCKANKSGIIEEIEVVFKNEKDAADLFSVADTAAIDQTGRQILNLIAANLPFEIWEDVIFESSTKNTALFYTESASGEWDNSVLYERNDIRFGYYQMQDGKYMAYLYYLLVDDEMNSKDLRYTKKELRQKRAFIFDGKSVKETEFNIPFPDVKDMPSDYELDPVPVLTFNENSVEVRYDCNVDLIDIMETTDEQPGTSVTLKWTGNGWEK